MGDPRRATLLVAFVALIAFAISLGGEFVLDDHSAIEGSSCVTGSLDLAAIFGRNFWCQPTEAQTIDSWRPWVVLWWWGAWAVGGGAAWPFHALNVGLHVAAAVVVSALTRAWWPGEGSLSRGVWAGLAFAVLPIHAEAVGSVVGAAELWAFVLGAASLLFASRAGASARSSAWWIGAVVLLAGALLSKESALVFAGLLLAIAYVGPGQHPRALVTGAIVSLVAAYLTLRGSVLGSTLGTHVTATVNPLVEAPVWMRFPMALDLLGRYIALAVVGYPLSADYGAHQIPVRVLSGFSAVGLAALVGVVFGGWRYRSHRGVLAAALWFLGAVTLALNIVAPLPAMFAERLFYTPSAPACMLLGCGATWLVAQRGTRGRVLASAVLVLWGVAAALHGWRWGTEDRITEITAENSPDSARAHVWRARVVGRLGDYEQMREHAKRATEILPEWATARALLASSTDATGNPEAALPLFRSAMDQDPSNPEIADLFIQFLLRYGHTEPAAMVYAHHAQARGGAADPAVTRP